MNDVFSAKHFHDKDAAREFLEGMRWAIGRVCPHCGVVDHSFATKKPGVYRCAEKACSKDFTVTTRSVMESSHIALNKWLQAFYLMVSSKKGISAHQLHRTLKVTYKSAWFMAHRIREAMRTGGLMPPMGEGGGEVEADETFVGRVKGEPVSQGTTKHRNVVLALVDRDTKQVRTFHIDAAQASEIQPIVRANLSKEAHLMTDQANYYAKFGKEFADHGSVDHSRDEYVRYASRLSDRKKYAIHTNTLEGYFSLFKRGMKGVYQHCGEQHLHRYLAEFEFRYNNRVALGVHDGERAALALKGAEGKRLTYRQPD